MRVGLRATHLINRIFTHSVGSASAVRWRTAHIKLLCSSSDESRGSRSSLLRHLTSKIQATGPITVAEYMREVLTNPLMGYYVRNDMLGPDGDFITSPEISQIFGELIGVWIISEWIGAGRPKQLQLVELGPGKGSLAADILRVFTQLHSVIGDASVSLHLVEVSPVLSRIQAQELTRTCSHEVDNTDTPVYCSGETATGLPVSWYRRLEDVPAGFSIFLAHEFFDALPVHKFEVNLVSFEEPLKGFQGFLSGSCLCQRTPKGWREVLVDIHPEKPEQLRFVLAPSPTLASSALVQADERRSHVEVCAEGGVLVQQLARRVAEHGGAALIADYGHDGTKTDTLRGFKGHRQHHVLADPGSADLTADVDFRYLRRMAGGGVACMGPLAQRAFLKNMGIDARMQVLLRNCTDASTRKQLINSYALLTDPAQMGERFNFFCLLHHGRLVQPQVLTGLKLEKRSPAQLPVAGFTELSYS